MTKPHDTPQRDTHYLRIAADVQKQIEDGALRPGARLPTEADMVQRYKVARGTVRRALDELVARGLVSRRMSGARAVVAEPGSVVVGLPPGSQEFDAPEVVDVVPAEPEVALALHVRAGDDVTRLRQIRYRNGEPFQFMVFYRARRAA